MRLRTLLPILLLIAPVGAQTEPHEWTEGEVTLYPHFGSPAWFSTESAGGHGTSGGSLGGPVAPPYDYTWDFVLSPELDVGLVLADKDVTVSARIGGSLWAGQGNVSSELLLDGVSIGSGTHVDYQWTPADASASSDDYGVATITFTPSDLTWEIGQQVNWKIRVESTTATGVFLSTGGTRGESTLVMELAEVVPPPAPPAPPVHNWINQTNEIAGAISIAESFTDMTSGTFAYEWDGFANSTLAHEIDLQSGSLTAFATGPSGARLWSWDGEALGSVELEDSEGTWTIQLELDKFVGSFDVDLYETGGDPPSNTGTNTNPINSGTNTEDESTQENKDSPGVGLVAALGLLGLAALRHHRKD